MKRYCLDTFALVCYLHNEDGADKVEELLRAAQAGKAQLFMHKINLGELYYTICRKEGESEADVIYGRVKDFPIQFTGSLEEDFLITVARLKSTYRISYADSFAAGLAIQEGLLLVTGDSDFRPLEAGTGVKILWLK